MARLAITWTKSTIGYKKNQQRVIESLGLRRLHHTVVHDDTPTIRGMINKIPHLLRVEEASDENN